MKMGRFITTPVYLLIACILFPDSTIFAQATTSIARDITGLQVKQPNGVTRYSQPIMSANSAQGEINVYNPSVIAVGDRLAMLYRVDAKGVQGSRIQLAFSNDGRNFVPFASNPVLVGEGPFEEHGVEDPRVVEFDGTYYLTYVGNAGSGEFFQCLATSIDLVHWEKKGVILTPAGWNKMLDKAGVIVPELKRCEEPFIEPQFKYDINSHHKVTLTEGAAEFKGMWRFYYGAADESIGLAEIQDLSSLLNVAAAPKMTQN